jgi:hypothetical protein
MHSGVIPPDDNSVIPSARGSFKDRAGHWLGLFRNQMIVLALDGVNVKLQSPGSANEETMLFKISGPASLQQEDAYQALTAAFAFENPNGASYSEREYIVDT